MSAPPPPREIPRVVTGRKWNRPQWEMITFQAPRYANGDPQLEEVGGVGQYGGGKTGGGAARFYLVACQNPFITGGGPRCHKLGDPPRSGIVAPTMTSLEQGALAQLRQVMDPKTVLHERMANGRAEITLINGHVISLYSAKGAIEGPNLCQIWPDEIQHPAYAGVGVWHNLRSRVRDQRAQRLNVQATGIARAGLPEKLFRRPSTATRRTVMFRTLDNKRNLAAGAIDALNDSISKAETATDADGWGLPIGAVWPEFGAHNLMRAPSLGELSALPVHVGIDLGHKAVIVFAVDITAEIFFPQTKLRAVERGLLIVDQIVRDNLSAEKLARVMVEEPKYRRWKVGAGSTIAMDPTSSEDEVMPFARAFPNASIRRETSGPYLEVATGYRCVARALRDGNDNTRLFVHPSLQGESDRGVPECLRLYLSSKTKDDKYEHGADAVRYLTVQRLPLPAFTYQPLVGLDPDEGLRAPWGG